MKTVKKAILGMSLTAGLAFVGLGFYNSISVNKTAFFENKLNIKFAKRLDEMNGKIVRGRMAASLPKFDASKSLKNVTIRRIGPKKTIKREVVKVETKKQVEEVELPEPAVMDARGLVLTGGLYDKKPLTSKYQFSGSASVVDGIVEEVSATLPDGSQLSINTRERMVGNVFQYEDSETREMKSGLFYKVKEGQYMISLTDDTKFSGLRLEFKTEEVAQSSKANWALNEQNKPQEKTQKDEYANEEVDMKAREWQEQQEQISEQAFNEFDQVELDEAQVENINEDMQRDSEQFGFQFQQG